MTRHLPRALAILGGLLALGCNHASADVLSTFSSDAQGWSVVSFGDLSGGNYSIVGTYAVTYNATGGNPGGYVSSTDPDGGDFTFSAPTAYLGNIASATALTYDLTHPEGAINYQTPDVFLFGTNGTQLVWSSNPPLVPGVGWTGVSLALAPSAEWHVGTAAGALATAADFQGVLASVSGLYLRGEYTFGGELAGIDNVNLLGVGPVPEPGSYALMLAGLGVVGFLAHRRRG